MRLNCFHDQKRLKHFSEENKIIFSSDFCFCCSRNDINLPNHPLYSEETMYHLLDEYQAWKKIKKLVLRESMKYIQSFQDNIKISDFVLSYFLYSNSHILCISGHYQPEQAHLHFQTASYSLCNR